MYFRSPYLPYKRNLEIDLNVPPFLLLIWCAWLKPSVAIEQRFRHDFPENQVQFLSNCVPADEKCCLRFNNSEEIKNTTVYFRQILRDEKVKRAANSLGRKFYFFRAFPSLRLVASNYAREFDVIIQTQSYSNADHLMSTDPTWRRVGNMGEICFARWSAAKGKILQDIEAMRARSNSIVRLDWYHRLVNRTILDFQVTLWILFRWNFISLVCLNCRCCGIIC